MEAYDTNKDGSLDDKEAAGCPALKAAFTEYDADSDGRISAGEISSRIQRHVDMRVGVTTIVCQVLLDDKPLSGAQVVFMPEDCMGGAIRQARGTSDDTGMINPEMEGGELPGLQIGLYKISVSKKDAQGKETLPARYNSETTLGAEVAPDQRNAIVLKLSRR